MCTDIHTNVHVCRSRCIGRDRSSTTVICYMERKIILSIVCIQRSMPSRKALWKRRRPASDGYRPREDEGSIWYLTEPLPTIIRPDQTARAVVSKANLENLQLSLSYKLCRVSTSIISQLCYKHLGDKSQNSACHSATPRRALRSGIHLNPEPAEQQHLYFAPCCEQQ